MSCCISQWKNYHLVELEKVEWDHIMARNLLILLHMRDHLLLLLSGELVAQSSSLVLKLFWSDFVVFVLSNRADFLFAIRYYPYTDRNNTLFRATQAKKINFNRPATGSRAIKDTSSSSGMNGTITTLAKYALVAVLCAVATKKLSWLFALVPKYKLVKVD